ncbi:MAG: valine--tRNA ligase [Candidatus Hodarchaeota archaeon]
MLNTKMKPEPKLKEKRWQHQMEKELYAQWYKEDLHKFNPQKGQEIYVVDTPPVYPSGTWHIGACAAYAMNDMIVRFERMRGKAVLAPFCLDRNGINIEFTVEKKYKKRLHDWDREEFNRKCKEEIDKISAGIIELSKRIGMGFDYDPPYYYETDSPEYRAFSQACFIELWHKGHIFEDYRPNNYCPDCGTTLADAEIYYLEKDTEFVYLRFGIQGSDEKLIIATTRPELLCACKAVLVHHDDERYKHLHGQSAIVPYYNIEVPIYPHYAADPEKGSGAVMICSYGDITDVQVFRELGLEPVIALDERARMTRVAGNKLKGLPVDKARKIIISELEEEGFIERREIKKHQIPTCERSKTPVEMLSLREWYVKQKEFAAKTIYNIIPQMRFHGLGSQILKDWAKSITIDWPISRRRYYHTEIPLWYCKKCQDPHLPEPGPYYQPWKQKAPFEKCQKCGATEFKGEERVFDTWMDSSVSNLYVTQYLQDQGFFEANFPCSLRPQGRDIVRTWLYYTLLKSYYHTSKPGFKHVWIHGMGLDKHGRRMSKSTGNVIDPAKTLDRVGGDAFRLWAASETNVGEDFRIDNKRIDGASKFLSKLWNICRFISTFDQVKEPKNLHPTDQWILAAFNELRDEAYKAYDDYNFFPPAIKGRSFARETFASHYIEMVKSRAYTGDESALATLHTVLQSYLQLMATIIPFITDKIYRDLYGQSVHILSFPEKHPKANPKFLGLTSKIEEFNSLVWKTKKDQELSLNQPITDIKIPKELVPFADDLKRMHNIR